MRILLSAIYPYVFLLLYLIIPFDNYIRALPNILLGVLIVTFPLIVRKSDFKKLRTAPVVGFVVFFAFLLVNSLIAGRFEEDFNIIRKVMIAVGLVILYIPVADVKKINSAIILSALAAIIFSVYNFVLIAHNSGSFILGDSPQVVESLLIDRLYLGMLCVFSIVISTQALKKEFHPENNYYLANILINAVFIILIASKISLIVLFVLLLINQFYGQRKIWRVILALTAIVGIIGLFFVLKQEKDLPSDSSESFHLTPAFMERSMTYELRSIVWHCAQEIIQNKGILVSGIGFQNTQEELLECYDTNIIDPGKKDDFISNRYNTHNQFLDFYISAGIIALSLFLIFILISFFMLRKNFFPTAMLAILVMYCLVENVFHRQIGAYYIGFILIVLVTMIRPIENNDLKDI